MRNYSEVVKVLGTNISTLQTPCNSVTMFITKVRYGFPENERLRNYPGQKDCLTCCLYGYDKKEIRFHKIAETVIV